MAGEIFLVANEKIFSDAHRMIFDADDLQKLASAYCAATGESLSILGRKALGNIKIFARLADGRGCNVLTARKAGEWFLHNWPDDALWPEDVPDHRREGSFAA